MKYSPFKAIFGRYMHSKPDARGGLTGDPALGIEKMLSALTGINDTLHSLSSSSEQDFLEIGRKLQDVYQRSSKMSELASRVVNAMTGDEIKNSISGLACILDELKGHIHSSESGFDKISEGLTEYRGTLEKVNSYFERFRMLVLNLDMLGFFTRVENAHIYSGDTGFTSLTNDVKNLSKRILDKSTQIQSKSLSLSKLIALALSEFAKFKESHKTHAMTMLDHSVSNHKILIDRHQAATSSAQAIEVSSHDVMEKIGDIVSSLQFHDITSQQIEHVRGVIGMLQDSIYTSDLSDAEKSGLIHEVCSLQGAQIKNTRKEAYAAVKNVAKSMEIISRSIKELMDDTRKVTWASDIEGLTFMEELDFGISTIIESLDENISEQSTLTNTMSSVSSMVSEMSVFVDEIENLGLNLQLIALNARIKAAHIGNEGAALDTISGSIYELSKNSRSDTSVLSGMLASVVDIAKQFDSNLQTMSSGQEKGVENLVTDLKNLLYSLHDMNDTVFETLLEMNNLGESLVDDIEKAVSGIKIHEEIEGTLETVTGTLEKISRKSKQMNPSSGSSASSSFMQELEKYYTMESEYQVHTDHVGSGREPESGTPKRGKESEYGDNVELF